MFNVKEHSNLKLNVIHILLLIAKYSCFFIGPICVLGLSTGMTSTSKLNIVGLLLALGLILSLSKHIVKLLNKLDNGLFKAFLQQSIYLIAGIITAYLFYVMLQNATESLNTLFDYLGWYIIGSMFSWFDRVFEEEIYVRDTRKRLRID